MKYERFLRGNSSNFRAMKGLTQQFDACEYKGRHGWLWYNPLNEKECYIAIEFCKDDEGWVIDILKDTTITPRIEIISHEPYVCDIKNKNEIKKKIKKIVKFIYDMDISRK